MSVNLHDVGDNVRVTGTFTDNAGDLTDPGAVFGQFRFDTQAAATEYEYGVDVELVKDSTGVYHFDIDTTGFAGRRCYYRLYSTGPGQASEEYLFKVEQSNLV